MTKKIERRIYIGLGLLLAINIVYVLVQTSRSDYLAWRHKRDAWHQRCDAYVGRAVPANYQEDVKDCQRELDALLDEAKLKGWAN